MYVAGREIMKDSLPTDHSNYVRLMTEFDEEEKANFLFQLGYREGKLVRLVS